MKKHAYLIHGWGGSPEEGWRPWLKKELEKRGFEVITPEMPDSENPEMGKWLNHLKKVVGKPDKNNYFVGHSLGNITILRYLESLKPSEKVGGVVLVAGFTSNLGFDELDSFFKTKINWKKIKSHCKKFVAIHSDNDPYVSTHYGEEIFQSNIGAKYILEHNKHHFNGDNGINKLPSALKSILEISNK